MKVFFHRETGRTFAPLLVLGLFLTPLYTTVQAADATLQQQYQSSVASLQSVRSERQELQIRLLDSRKAYLQSARAKNQAVNEEASLRQRLVRKTALLQSMNMRLRSLQKNGSLDRILSLSALRTQTINEISELQERYRNQQQLLSDKTSDYQQKKSDYFRLERQAQSVKRSETAKQAQMQALQRKMKLEKARDRLTASRANQTLKGSAPTVNASVTSDAAKIPLSLGDLTEAQRIVDGFTRDDFSTTVSLSWPVEPTRGISAYFHDENYVKIFGIDHYAIDIVADQGTEVVAPSDGYVLKAESNGTGFSYLLILHDNGYLTFYGHLSRIDVEVGDLVRRDSLLGLSGGQPGTTGAGSKTTGPHLHFEVWKDGNRVDPMPYLPK